MEGYIPGIYNCCDHWCERCTFRQRCAVFVGSAELPEDPTSPDFWNGVLEQFAATHGLTEDITEYCSIEVHEPTPDEMEAWKSQADALDAQLNANPLIAAADAYADGLDDLLADPVLWKEKGKALAQETVLGIKTQERCYNEIDVLSDCHEVLCWYQHFIAAKFRRALSGQLEAPGEAYADSDVNGSAKIALLAVERSRLALSTLFRHIPDEDKVLPLLALLDRLEKLGAAQFPDARAFVRPGFDEVPQAAGETAVAEKEE
jgi:hypothetical protein